MTNASDSIRVHGDRNVQELQAMGLLQVPLLDFAVNLNPFGPPAFLRDALRSVNFVDYPERTNHVARLALAEAFGTTPEHVVVGNGACELLWSLARLWRGGKALMVEPTFSEFAAAMAAEGGVVRSFRASEHAQFQPDVEDLSRALTESPADVVYFCNPNNPTGGFVPLARLERLACTHPRSTFIIDESFLSLSDHADARFQAIAAPNIVRLRSLTKDFSIAGVRVGYLLAAPDLLRRLDAVRAPWTVSSLAQVAVTASLQGEAFLAESRGHLTSLRDLLTQGLQNLGLRVIPSSVNYVLVNVAREAAPLRKQLLLGHHLVVRDCASFGLPEHLRLCLRPRSDIARLLAALASTL